MKDNDLFRGADKDDKWGYIVSIEWWDSWINYKEELKTNPLSRKPGKIDNKRFMHGFE